MTIDLDDLRTFITGRLTQIRELVNRDVDRARIQLRQHAQEIIMQPHEDHYVARGEWNVLGNQELTREETGGMRVWMVAGGGFEPPTFGL